MSTVFLVMATTAYDGDEVVEAYTDGSKAKEFAEKATAYSKTRPKGYAPEWEKAHPAESHCYWDNFIVRKLTLH